MEIRAERTSMIERSGCERKLLIVVDDGRSMVYVEGEASMRKFQRENEGEQQALSIVQRTSS